ncbi:hypothetical protein ABE25_14170 [Cytobacillus firmus]|nr:hypothetical protein [Cytobacillus firmus]MBG9603281.1 hypothetical protein [Cytobacillus firmus]
MTKYEDWKAFTKIFMKATKKKREKLPKNSSNKNLTQSFFSSPMIFPFSPDIIIHLESHNFTDRKGKDIIA